jgi:hypothetical protein
MRLPKWQEMGIFAGLYGFYFYLGGALEDCNTRRIGIEQPHGRDGDAERCGRD